MHRYRSLSSVRNISQTCIIRKYSDYILLVCFRPDEGGWNNIRMAAEVAMIFAHAAGRVLGTAPPSLPFLPHYHTLPHPRLTYYMT